MNDQRIRIKQALEAVVEAQRHKDFQRLAVHLAKRLWPEVQATEEHNDGGEDATSFVTGSDGLRRSVAVSLSGTLAKVKADAARIKQRGVKLDCLVFITPIAVNNLTVSDWAAEVSKEFSHGLHVIQQAEVITLLEQPENRWLCKEYLGLELAFEVPVARLLAVARETSVKVVNGWKTVHGYNDPKTIELTLLQDPAWESGKTRDEARRLGVEDLCRIALDRRSSSLYGDPGAGKTFTLIQLADALLQKPGAPVPILVPLPIWAASGKSLLAFIESQFHGNEVKADDLANLFAIGHVALLLNGWNEVPDASVERIVTELKALVLHNPALSIFISTRNTRTSAPVPTHADIFVAPLSREQKMEMVRKSGHENPEAFERDLESNNALATITSTPLFLSVAIAISQSGEKLLQTRYGLLAQVIEHFEKSSEHSIALKNSPCNSLHRRHLESIAVKMTQDGGTALAFDEVTSLVAQCHAVLRAEGHVEKVPNSAEVLDCLVGHHLLVLTPGPAPSYRFIHQQFQEWFAAESLRRTIAALGENQDPKKIFAFQRDFLNRRQWQEPLAFLMERLQSGGEAEIGAAADLIRWALPVNLSLASELAGVAGGRVWEQVRNELGRTLRTWYEKSGKDCRGPALAAMLATGASDFQEITWPLIESSDQDTRLFTYRVWRPFRLSCLGPQWRERFFKWDAKRKAEFLEEISWEPHREHVALAAELLKKAEAAEVKLACFEVLLNSRAYELLLAHSESSAVREWPNGFVERILFGLPRRFLGTFLHKAKAALPSIQQLSARHAIIMSLKRGGDPEWPALMKQQVRLLIEDEALDFRAPNDYHGAFGEPSKRNAGPYLAELLSALDEKEPEWVAAFVADMLTQGRLWFDSFMSYVRKMASSDAERVTQAALDDGVDPHVTRQRCAALAPIGSLLFAKALLKAFLAYAAHNGKSPSLTPLDRGDALRSGIQELSVHCLVDSVLDEVKQNSNFDSIRAIVKLMSQMPLTQASDDRKAAFRLFALQVDQQTPIDLNGREWLRAELADILGRVGVPSDAVTIEKWILEDVARLSKDVERQQVGFQRWEAGGRKGQPPVRVIPVVFWNHYQRALVQLGGKDAEEALTRLLENPSLLNLAAFGLYLLSRDPDEKPDLLFGDRPDYAGVWQRQQEVKTGASPTEPAKNYAERIYTAIQRYLPELEKESSRFPKHELRGAIAALAAVNDARAIPLLSRFASDKYSSWAVINALHNLMLQGTALSGDEMAAIVEPTLAEHETQRWSSNNDNWYLMVRAIAILLFSDKPLLGIEGIRRLPEYRLRNHYIRDVLVLLGASQAPEAIELILELAFKPEINQHYFYDVATVLSHSRNPAAEGALIALLNKFCGGELNSNAAHSHLPRALARAVETGGKIWQDIERRCAAPQSTHERKVLLSILSEVEELDASACLCDLINDEIPVGYVAEHLIEEAVTQKVPAGGSSYYIRPRDASDLKRRLINIAHADVTRRASATHLLNAIGRARLEHGWPANEPLHPDIALIRKLDGPWELF